MSARLVSTREAGLWVAGFLVVAALLVGRGFTSQDPDSALYAGISARLAQEPVHRWLAPEWWGFWPEAEMTGYFREHPAGVFLLPAALARLGVPAEQGAYVVGLAAGLASLLMMAWLIGRLTARDEARAALLLLQLMPVAFIFRVRANHEYPMLACLLLALIALVRVADRRPLWQGLALAGVALAAGLFIKGVFVLQILLAIGVWIAVNPTGQAGARVRQAVVAAAAVLLMAAAGAAYDAAYRAATGEGFWIAYWARQMGPLAEVGPVDMALTALRNVLFYASRLLWHPAPWTAALVVAAWRARGSWTAAWRGLPETSRRGLLFALTFAALAVLMLSPAARYAERYAFSATYAVACAGAVATGRVWPAIAERLRRWDAAVPGLPALLWLGLTLLRLGTGAWLPRL